MAVNLAFEAPLSFGDSKGILLKATFTGVYGTITVGDLLKLFPSQNGGVDGGVTDPFLAYDMPLNQVTPNIGIFGENIGGSYCQVKPNAVPSLLNTGLLMFEPNGTEKATGAAYTATELAGYVYLQVLIPGNQ